MSKTPSRPRRGGRFMYQSHPDRDTLFAGNPANLVTATQNIQPIHFDDLHEMRQIVWDLASFIVEWQPDLIPFFATGGIPYLIPVMHVLEKTKQHGFNDGQHFHLFPGLTWGGSIGDEDSETYFASTFGSIVCQRLGGASPVRVLVIDTTNSGNAVNKAVGACQRAIKASGASSNAIALKVIGIVNTSHAEAKRGSAEKSLVSGAKRAAHVLTPSGFSAAALKDRQFALFSPLVPDEGVPFEAAYWLAGNIPTEDKAELIGVEAVHESLSTSSEAKAGRLKIVYGNGESQQGAGLGTLPGRLISLLSMPLEAWQWGKMRDINNLPPLTPQERDELAEAKELSEGGLRLFELNSMDCSDAVDELMRLPRLLTDAEVYWLGTIEPPPTQIAPKVRASLEKKSCTATEALKYFRRAFPTLAADDPGGDASPAWWDGQIRSLPKEVPAKRGESSRPINAGHESEPTDVKASDEGGERATADEAALDFVVAVGSVEAARTLLSNLKGKWVSLDDIEKHLEATWPVTADKAVTFIGPTNEQVAMQFALECGGWDEATLRLEAWVLKMSEGAA